MWPQGPHPALKEMRTERQKVPAAPALGGGLLGRPMMALPGRCLRGCHSQGSDQASPCLSKAIAVEEGRGVQLSQASRLEAEGRTQDSNSPGRTSHLPAIPSCFLLIRTLHWRSNKPLGEEAIIMDRHLLQKCQGQREDP